MRVKNTAMLKRNIKKVHFSFDLSSVVGATLESSSAYRPSNVEDELQRNCCFNTPDGLEHDVTVAFHFPNNKEDHINITVSEYQDYSAPDFDFDKVAKKFAEFTVSLPIILDRRDWMYYIEKKKNMGGNILVPFDMKPADAEETNFHNYLAKKLKAYLKEKGFSHYTDDLEGEPDFSMESRLIGIAKEYHEACLSPGMLRRGFGIRY